MMKYTLLLASLLIFLNVNATTWDEPWRKEIIQAADFMVLAEVTEATDSAIVISIEKCIGGELSGKVTIDNFYMLRLCSVSGGHGPEFHFDEGNTCYFFLKLGENGNYQLPTPTAGFDYVKKGDVNQVAGCFRHSYHKALVDQDTYEMAYNCIWPYLHDKDYSSDEIGAFILENLKKTPAGFEPDEIDIFFKQHVALESAYLLDIEVKFSLLKPFAESDNFHSQVGALRAMQNVTSGDAADFLLNYIDQEDKSDFSKLMAIQALLKVGDKKALKKLNKKAKSISDEPVDFGGNIMDPRVCTSLLSLKAAAMSK